MKKTKGNVMHMLIDNGRTLYGIIRNTKNTSFVRMESNSDGRVYYFACNRKAKKILRSKRAKKLGLEINLELNAIT